MPRLSNGVKIQNNELEKIVDEAIIDFTEKEALETIEKLKESKPMTKEQELMFQTIQEVSKTRSAVVDLKNAMNIKRKDELDTQKVIAESILSILAQNNKWKIGYLALAVLFGVAIGIIIAVNWQDIAPYKDMIIEFFKSSNQVVKNIT